jgi:hypothetical protein
LGYQWRFNGLNLAGATAATLALNNLAFSQAGNYDVVVSNAAGVVISAPAALVVADLPNLVPFQPAGWSDKIVAATTSGSTTDASIIYNYQDVYVSWAVLNSATNGSITVRFFTQLFLDGILNQTWHTDGLDPNFYTFVTNYDIGKLTAGTHTLSIVTDTTGAVDESNKNDNQYIKTLIVSSTNSAPPSLSSPSFGSSGQFQFTLMGIPSRSYQILASTNLTDWSVLATLVSSNGTGLLPYSDPSATNFNRRFYRGQLLNP